MMKFTLIAALAAIGLSAPAFAEGDAAAGEKIFGKCKTCHSIVGDDGTVIQKGGKVGPNLYGVIGRPLGSYPDFKYGDGILAAGAKGLVWDQAMLAAYVVDPTKWLDENSGDPKAKSKMAFKLPKGGEDVAAYLASVKPAP
jgi:cytochrome c